MAVGDQRPTAAGSRRPGEVSLVVTAVVLAVACEIGQGYVAVVSGIGDPVIITRSVVALTLAALGGLVVLRGQERTYGWLMVALGVVISTQNLAASYVGLAWVGRPDGDWPFAMAAAWYQDTWMVSWLLGFLLLPALFPDGRPASRRWGRAVHATTTAWTVVIVAFMTMERPLEGFFEGNAAIPDPPMNPTGMWAIGTADAGLVIGPPWILVTMVSVVIGIGSLVTRWRGSDGQGRRQIGLVAWALGLLLTTVGLDVIDTLLVEGPGIDLGLRGVIDLAFAVAIVAWAVALGLAVLRYRLYEVDTVVNRTIVYGVLTAGVLVAYVLVVVGVGSLLPDASGEGLALVAIVLVALAFDPARRRVQTIVNRVMFGQRDEPYTVLSRLGDIIAGAGTPVETLQTLVATVATSLKLPWVAIELDQRDEQMVRAEAGSPAVAAGDPMSVPIVHRDERVGRLLVVPRSPHEALGPADQRLLEDVARAAGAVAATARLTLDLQRSREQLVLAREEERRRIRRDLHDGLGPSLAAQTLALDAVADRIGPDPAMAKQLLGSLKHDNQKLVADIRRLVHELRPPALDELGLAGALVAHVAQVDGTGSVAVRIRTAPDPLPELSAAVEVAAYRIAREALTNVLRHAEAGACTITVTATATDLQVRIVDDGVGLPVVPRAGVGLRSMRERTEELGGTFNAADAPDGGTEVVAILPRARSSSTDPTAPAAAGAVAGPALHLASGATDE
jgi:signal transduction histidine kinase